jgi:hypothetical protein
MGVHDALQTGAQRALNAARGRNEGHIANFLGQMRHFDMNEAFHRTLEFHGLLPHPLRGNEIVTGQAGPFTLARLNIREGDKLGKRKSATRSRLSSANLFLQRLVESEIPGLLDNIVDQTTSGFLVLFVAIFPWDYKSMPSLYIGVPDPIMESWLLWESLDKFIARYNHEIVVTQDDFAMPKLKHNTAKKDGTLK